MKGRFKHDESYSYVNNKDTKQQTYCSYKFKVRLRFVSLVPTQEEAHEPSDVTLQNGDIVTNLDGFCPKKADGHAC